MNKTSHNLTLVILIISLLVFQGFSLFKKKEVPAEYRQKVLVLVSDQYQLHQATQSKYDSGDLQSFHTQHTLPITVIDSEKEIFPQAELVYNQENLEQKRADGPAILEVRMIDLANDIYLEPAEDYRAQLTLAVALKNQDDEIIWQKAFRGDGYVAVDPQFSTGLGPNDAVVDALRDALGQIQDDLLKSPEIRDFMRVSQQARIDRGESSDQKL